MLIHFLRDNFNEGHLFGYHELERCFILLANKLYLFDRFKSFVNLKIIVSDNIINIFGERVLLDSFAVKHKINGLDLMLNGVLISFQGTDIIPDWFLNRLFILVQILPISVLNFQILLIKSDIDERIISTEIVASIIYHALEISFICIIFPIFERNLLRMSAI